MAITVLKKLHTELTHGVATYFLRESVSSMPITPGMTIRIGATGRAFCIACNRLIAKVFGQGFCFPCFKHGPENSECIIRPELCRGHLGDGRDPDWERLHHCQPHVVYIANSGGIKVGVTRSTQVPTRWIDQGAIAAKVIAETPNRYLAGCIEVALKPILGDKTRWQNMLKGVDEPIDLDILYTTTVKGFIPSIWSDYLAHAEPVRTITYPVRHYPTQIKSLKLEATPDISGTVLGIRGQYLLLDNNRVLNIRNHSGIEVDIELTYNQAVNQTDLSPSAKHSQQLPLF